jgi:hypothetical protein
MLRRCLYEQQTVGSLVKELHDFSPRFVKPEYANISRVEVVFIQPYNNLGLIFMCYVSISLLSHDIRQGNGPVLLYFLQKFHIQFSRLPRNLPARAILLIFFNINDINDVL